MVERHLAKVNVAGSNLVSRSTNSTALFFYCNAATAAGWLERMQSSLSNKWSSRRYSQEVRHGPAKPWLPGSNPGGASKTFMPSLLAWRLFVCAAQKLLTKNLKSGIIVSLSWNQGGLLHVLPKAAKCPCSRKGLKIFGRKKLTESSQKIWKLHKNHACVVESADTRDLKSLGWTNRIGSSPITSTIEKALILSAFSSF